MYVVFRDVHPNLIIFLRVLKTRNPIVPLKVVKNLFSVQTVHKWNRSKNCFRFELLSILHGKIDDCARWFLYQIIIDVSGVSHFHLIYGIYLYWCIYGVLRQFSGKLVGVIWGLKCICTFFRLWLVTVLFSFPFFPQK